MSIVNSELETTRHHFHIDRAGQLHITRLDGAGDSDTLPAPDAWALLAWLYDNHRDLLLRESRVIQEK